MSLLALPAVAAICALIAWRWEPWIMPFAALLFGLIILPYRLTHFGPTTYNGISAAQPELYTYSAAVAISVVVLGIRRRLSIPKEFLPLGLFLIFGFVELWQWTSESASGLLQITTAIFAWAVGV